jgi:hypothetical protein
MQRVIVSVLAATILLGTAAATHAETVMKQCGEQWQAAKAAGTTNGATWPQFLAQCRTQLDSKAGTAAPTPAAVQPQTGSLFPWQQPASPPPGPTTSTTGGNQSVMRQCGAQWQAAKAAGTTGGATWPQFLKACRGQFASTTSAPQGGFAPAAPAPLLRQRNRVHCFRGSGQPLRLLGAQRRREPGRRRKLSIAVPDRRSFGSMNTRTSTISPALGITGTRKAALTYARRRRKLQAIAPR